MSPIVPNFEMQYIKYKYIYMSNNCLEIRDIYLQTLKKHRSSYYNLDNFDELLELDTEYQECLHRNNRTLHKKLYQQRYYHSMYIGILNSLSFTEKINFLKGGQRCPPP